MTFLISFILPALINGFFFEFFKQKSSESFRDLLYLGKRIFLGTLGYAIALELYFLLTDSELRNGISLQRLSFEIIIISAVFFVLSYVGVLIAMVVKKLLQLYPREKKCRSN